MAIARRIVGGSGAADKAAPTALKIKPRPGLQTSAKSKPFKNTELLGELAQVFDETRKQLGTNIIRRGTDTTANYGRLRSGILVGDLCFGGGLRLSRGAMFMGEKSAGKSTLATIFAANAQRVYRDKWVVWIDVEGTFDTKWAQKLGVDLDRLIIIEPESGEEAVDLAQATLQSNETSMLITDSIAMLTPIKEVEDSAEDSQVAAQSRLVAKYIRKMNQIILLERHRNHFPALLHLNQFRLKIGVVFGDPRVAPGGKILEFSTSQQAIISKQDKWKSEKQEGKAKEESDGEDENEIMYTSHNIQMNKDKTGGRLKEGRFKIIRNPQLMKLPEGFIDQAKTIINFGQRAGLVKGDRVFEIEGLGKVGSVDQFRNFMVENPKKIYDVQTKIVDFYRKRWDIT